MTPTAGDTNRGLCRYSGCAGTCRNSRPPLRTFSGAAGASSRAVSPRSWRPCRACSLVRGPPPSLCAIVLQEAGPAGLAFRCPPVGPPWSLPLTCRVLTCQLRTWLPRSQGRVVPAARAPPPSSGVSVEISGVGALTRWLLCVCFLPSSAEPVPVVVMGQRTAAPAVTLTQPQPWAPAALVSLNVLPLRWVAASGIPSQGPVVTGAPRPPPTPL